MRTQIPKLIQGAFYIQLALFAVSTIILVGAQGYSTFLAVYTLLPMIALAPVVAVLAIFFPWRQWRQYLTKVIVVALLINITVSAIIFVRFVVISFILHAA